MSAILKKRGTFWPKCSHFVKKGVYIVSRFKIENEVPTDNLCGSSVLISIKEKRSAFCRKRVPIKSSKISVLRKKGSFLQ